VNALADLLSITDALEREEPLFHVEAPDGRKTLAELPRQRSFLNLLIYCAPEVLASAIPNAGKRNPRLAKLEGIRAGLFDVHCAWNHGDAWIEFKGYTSGSPNKITHAKNAAQVGWGNRMTRLGHRVACFFDERAALVWLESLGAPVNLKVLHGLR
jgi:hypothetical protein